jgi:hypothetical protein
VQAQPVSNLFLLSLCSILSPVGASLASESMWPVQGVQTFGSTPPRVNVHTTWYVRC